MRRTAEVGSGVLLDGEARAREKRREPDDPKRRAFAQEALPEIGERQAREEEDSRDRRPARFTLGFSIG